MNFKIKGKIKLFCHIAGIAIRHVLKIRDNKLIHQFRFLGVPIKATKIKTPSLEAF
jgi:hypothetical protein